MPPGADPITGAAFARRVLLTVLITFVVVTVGWGVSVGVHYHWVRRSASLRVLGRDYERGTTSVTLQQARASEGAALVVIHNGRVVMGQTRGSSSPTVIYVEHGTRYWDYELEGGP